MPDRYKARVNVRRFLNYPGFHGRAYVIAYVEDTRARSIEPADSRPHAFDSDRVPRPRTILEIADCDERIMLQFDLHNDLQVANSLHKIDSLLEALTAFRRGFEAEARLYAQRRQSLSTDRVRSDTG